jgi:hypothetical protein
MRQREASLDTNEAPCESDNGTRDIPCFLPLPAELHAMCQCGPDAKIPSSPIFYISLPV